MAKTVVTITDTLNTWRAKTNDISLDIGDITQISTSGSDSDIVGSINNLDSDLGVRASLTTANKTSLQHAINEIDAEIGTIASLTTANKSNIVAAINELETNHNNLDSSVGTRASLTTTNKTSFQHAINEHDAELGVITAGAMLTTASTVSTAIKELHTELHLSGVSFGNFGNSHTGARLAADDFLAATQEIIDEVGDITRINTGWSGGTAAAHGGGNHDSSVVGSILALAGRIDSDNTKVDQSVKANATPVFASAVLGTYPANTSGNATYSNAQIVRTGDYKIDVSGDITLDAAGNNVILTNATNQVNFTLGTNFTMATNDSGDFTADVGGNIILDAAKGDWSLKAAGSTVFGFNQNGTITRPGGLVLDVANNIVLDADGGQVTIKDNGITHYTFDQGATDEMTTVNQFKIDAGGKITLDAHNGITEFSMKDSSHAVFTAGNATNTFAVDNDYLVDVAGNITLDADGGTLTFADATTAQMSFIGGTNKEMDIPSGDFKLDVSGNINIDADGGVVKFQDANVDKLTLTMGTNQTVATPGDLTIDVASNITLDADDGEIIFKDGGTQFAKFKQAASNHMSLYVNDNLAIEFKEQGNGSNNKEDIFLHGPLFTDSALQTDIVGKSVGGALNQLDTEVDTLQTLVGSTSASNNFTNISATTVVPAVQELATELYASGVSFGNFGAGVQYSGTTARLTATNFKTAMMETVEELGDVAWLRPGTTFSANSTSAFRALAELWDLVSQLDSNTTASFTTSNASVGTLASLDTTTKANAVAAINELHSDATTLAGRVTTVENRNTGAISEGSNLYFTNARARGAVSGVDAGGDGSFAYNSSTGAFTYTGPSAAEARAHLSASSGVSYNSSSGVISGDLATTSGLGVAKFSSSNFTVSGAGEVSLKANATALANLPAITTNNRLLGRIDAGNDIVAEVTVNTNMIDNDAVTYPKIQNVATANRVLGSTSAGGVVAEVQVATDMIANNAVTRNQMANSTIQSGQLNNSKRLIIKNSSGTQMFSIYGPGT